MLRRVSLMVALACCASAGALSACGVKRVALPAARARHFQTPDPRYEEAVKACRSVRTIRATLGLSGRAGSTRSAATSTRGSKRRRRSGSRAASARPSRLHPRVTGIADHPLHAARESRDAERQRHRHRRGARRSEAEPHDLRTLVSGCGFEVGSHLMDGSTVTVWLRSGLVVATYLRQEQGRWRVVPDSAPAVEGALFGLCERPSVDARLQPAARRPPMSRSVCPT